MGVDLGTGNGAFGENGRTEMGTLGKCMNDNLHVWLE